MSLLLLDTSPLVALAWESHQFHLSIRRRMENSPERWATCAVTQLGFIRISLTPAIARANKTAAYMSEILAQMTADSRHRYLEDLPTPLNRRFRPYLDRVRGHQQVTDAYLLALAEHYSARLLTFDSRLAALANGRDDLVEVLS